MSEITVFEIIVFIIKTFLIQIDLNLEHIMFNDIIVYNIPKVVIQIAFVIDEFFEIWKDQSVIVNIFEEEWMFISLKLDAAFKSSRVYFIN